MVNRPARFTVAELVRAGKAAKDLGPEWCVEVAPAPDNTIRLVRRTPPSIAEQYDWSPSPPPTKLRVF